MEKALGLALIPALLHESIIPYQNIY